MNSPAPRSLGGTMVDLATARMNMVESQLRPNRVTDPRIITAFETLPRERFVPEDRQAIAYVDEDLKIAKDRYLMEPMVLARLISAADVRPTDLALVVGCDTGYAAAVMASLAATVVALECDDDLAALAEKNLAALAVDNAVVVRGKLQQGYPKQAPYDVILINGGIEVILERIQEQLGDHGRLVMVERRSQGCGRAVLIERFGDAFGRRTLFDAATPVLPGFEREKRFVF